MFLPRQVSNNGMRSNNQWRHSSHVTMWTRSLPSPSYLSSSTFFHLMNSIQHPRNAVLSRLTAGPALVLIEIIAWYEAEPPLCSSSYSYHGVTGWHRDSMDILQRAECWKCIPEQHRGCNPLRTYKLLDTVCCVLSTTTVIVEFCLIWCGGSLRIAWW